MYSAIKKGGRKLYEIARAGETIALTPRRITIYGIEIVGWSPPECVLDVTSSAGTYIRSLAFDLGEALGVGAYLSGLARTASGSFRVEEAVALEELLESDAPQDFLIAPRDALAQFPSIVLEDAALDEIRHGRAIPNADAPAGTDAFAYAEDGQFVAVLRSEGGVWKPQKVFIT
jgi:tRNA pseudouridine55 synthase